MAWEKLKPLEKPGFRSGCLNCGSQPELLPMEAELAVGFGACTVTRGDDCLYQEGETDDIPKLQHYEDMAKADPDHDWRASFHGPLSDTEYQRHGEGKWVLVKKGLGFA